MSTGRQLWIEKRSSDPTGTPPVAGMTVQNTTTGDIFASTATEWVHVGSFGGYFPSMPDDATIQMLRVGQIVNIAGVWYDVTEGTAGEHFSFLMGRTRGSNVTFYGYADEGQPGLPALGKADVIPDGMKYIVYADSDSGVDFVDIAISETDFTVAKGGNVAGGDTVVVPWTQGNDTGSITFTYSGAKNYTLDPHGRVHPYGTSGTGYVNYLVFQSSTVTGVNDWRTYDAGARISGTVTTGGTNIFTTPTGKILAKLPIHTDGLNSLGARVTHNETAIQGNTDAINVLDTDLDGKITANTTNIASNSAAIAALQNNTPAPTSDRYRPPLEIVSVDSPPCRRSQGKHSWSTLLGITTFHAMF